VPWAAQKLTWQKFKIFIYSFLNVYILLPAQPLKLHSCINTAVLCIAGRVVPAPLSIMIKLWHCDEHDSQSLLQIKNARLPYLQDLVNLTP